MDPHTIANAGIAGVVLFLVGMYFVVERIEKRRKDKSKRRPPTTTMPEYRDTRYVSR